MRGLALLGEGRALGRCSGAIGTRASACVGIHTGGVLLGGRVDGDASIRGIAVNIAARMEQNRPPGGLRISDDTFALVRGGFDVEPQDPIAVRASTHRSSPTSCCARGRAFRARGGHRGPDDARSAATPRLPRSRRPRSRAVADRCLTAVTVVAEAGVGRTGWWPGSSSSCAPARTTCASCAAGRIPRRPEQPYGLLRDTLAWQLGSSTATAWRRAAQGRGGIAPWFEADDGPELAQAQAHLLGHLIGLDFGSSPRGGHPRRPAPDPQPRLPPRPRCCAAVPAARRWCCCSKTCTGPTTPRWTSLPTCRRRARHADVRGRADAARAVRAPRRLRARGAGSAAPARRRTGAARPWARGRRTPPTRCSAGLPTPAALELVARRAEGNRSGRLVRMLGRARAIGQTAPARAAASSPSGY